LLSANDVRELLRLVGEVRERGDDPAAWRRHALEGLVRLCKARAGAFAEHWLHGHGGVAPRQPPLEGPADPGAAKAACAVQTIEFCLESARAQRAANAGATPARPARGTGLFDPLGAAWRALADDPTRQRSARSEITRSEGQAGEYLSSYQPVPALSVVDSVHLYRDPSEPAFEAAQMTTLVLFHEELGRAWRASAHLKVPTMPPRQATVLRLLLRGKREKEIADELAIAPSTVHTYVVALYRRLGVSSRGELAAYMAAAERRTLPRLLRVVGT
jgi:DNA-binding CsgD family transcriptional regulator